jgi:hypothetical protein
MSEQLERQDFIDDDRGEAGLYFNDLATAIQYWSICQNRTTTTVAEAATAFNLSPAVVKEAVESHYWMLISGPDDDFTKMVIEHDGE